jgi:hypothetical protein
MKALATFTLVLVAATLAAGVESARACSCIQPDPWAYLKQADGAFVGRLVSREDAGGGRARMTFSVERAVKGNIASSVEVLTPNNGAACGIETTVGRRIGLFLWREDGQWKGMLCWQVPAEDLLAAAALPAPNGRWPVAMYVGGRFGPARTIALDAKGRTLAYGVGSGSVRQHAACPGGRRVVELVQRGSGLVVAVRELPTFWLVREQRLPRREYGVASLRCVDSLGERLAVFSSGPDGRGLLAQITPRRVTTLWRGKAFYASFWRNVAFVQAHARAGTRIVRIDLRTGAAKPLGTVRPWGLYELVPNAAGTLLAGDSHKEGIGDPRLVVIDLSQRPITARTIPLRADPVGSTLWLTRDTLAYLIDDTMRTYTASLRPTGRIPGWDAADGVVVGRSAYGVTHSGGLIRADLATRKIRLVRRLPGKSELIVSATR